MTSRSGRGRWERVLAARRQARLSLGQDPDSPDDAVGRPKPRSPLAPVPTPRMIEWGSGVGVLFPGEAAQRLGMSRPELEAIVAVGKVKTLPLDYGYVIPTTEVERLGKARS